VQNAFVVESQIAVVARKSTSPEELCRPENKKQKQTDIPHARTESASVHSATRTQHKEKENAMEGSTAL
jgi:hypothetical protein